MKTFDEIKFLGKFRNYQQRVLDNSSKYLINNKIHIVAAPGSGKTILGLELIRRLKSPCIVLSPTNTIKFQWGERFEEMYLPKGENIDDYVSFDLHNIRPITSITYQALYAAMERLSCEDEDGEIIDYKDINLFETIKQYGINTICVDEAHHLQNKWQKSLEKFIGKLGRKIKIVALTATPPYDATGAEWSRYLDICGEIDEEIFATELVMAKNLCPHQDYVYLNYPTIEESEFFKDHQKKISECQEELKNSQQIIRMGSTIFQNRSDDFIVQERANFVYVFGMLKYLEIPFDEQHAKRILKVQKFDSNLLVCEKAFDYLLTNEYILTTELKEHIKSILKNHGLLPKGQVRLVLSDKLESTLTYSMGKLESINNIVRCELDSQKDKLRMLILTDYIRNKDKDKIGTDKLFKDISIVSIFEMIRRKYPQGKIGILSGGLAVLPSSMEDKIRKLIKDGKKKSLTCKPLGNTGFSEYDFNISNKEKVRIVGKIFEDGLINILVGTKSLLGEGWDSPCINSLILASFVGSFMLSNQMRGRAIRVYKKDPNKTANIWHLVTLNPSFANKDPNNIMLSEETSSDYKTVKRRFQCFVGPHYENKLIRGGLSRVSILKEVMTSEDLKTINKEMEERATNREEMARKWLENPSNKNLYLETAIPYERITKSMVYFSVPNAVLCGWLLWFCIMMMGKPMSLIPSVLVRLGLIALSSTMLFYLFKIVNLCIRKNFVKSVSKAILKCLTDEGKIKCGEKLRIKKDRKNKTYDVVLIDNNMQDQRVFNKVLTDFFTYPSDGRYLLVKKFYTTPVCKYSYQIPRELCKNKVMAKDFASKLWFLRSYGVYYTKSNKKMFLNCKRQSYLFGLRPIEQQQTTI